MSTTIVQGSLRTNFVAMGTGPEMKLFGPLPSGSNGSNTPTTPTWPTPENPLIPSPAQVY